MRNKPVLYVVHGRQSGKTYEQIKNFIMLLGFAERFGFNIKPFDIRKEKHMMQYTFKKEPVKPVMSEYIKRYQFPQPDIKFHYEHGSDVIATVTNKVTAKVVDAHDEAICNEIKAFAAKNGFTDLYLIDKNFVIRALKHDKIVEYKNETIAEQQAEIEKLKKELDIAHMRNADAVEQCAALRAKLRAAHDECDNLKKELNAYRDRVKNLEARYKTLQISRDIANERCVELREELAACYEELRKYEEARRALKNFLN